MLQPWVLRRESVAFQGDWRAYKVRAMGGLAGLYRGILPGSLSVFLRNGAARVRPLLILPSQKAPPLSGRTL